MFPGNVPLSAKTHTKEVQNGILIGNDIAKDRTLEDLRTTRPNRLYAQLKCVNIIGKPPFDNHVEDLSIHTCAPRIQRNLIFFLYMQVP